MALVVGILLWEEMTCIYFRKTLGGGEVFGLWSVSPQPMLLCVIVIAQI